MRYLTWPLLALVVAICATGCADADGSTGNADSELTYSSSRNWSESDSVSSSGDSDVGYYNPSTGYGADYTLDVDRDSDGEVERINFPNGGWEDDFVSKDDNGDGTSTLTDEDGREFTVPNE